MIEPNYGTRFLLKPLQALRVTSKESGQKFNRGFAARHNIGGQINFTHSAAAYPTRNLVVTNGLTEERISLPILNHFRREPNR